MVTTCSANSKVQFALLKWLIFTYLFTTEYSSRQNLLDSDLESSTRVTRVTRHSPIVLTHSKARHPNSQRDWKRYHHLRSKTQKACRQAYHSYLDSFVSDNTEKQPKKFFTGVKFKRNDCSGVRISLTWGFVHNDRHQS